MAAAAGNPGLQAMLTRPILGGEFEAAEEALGQIDVYRATGAPPEEIEALIEAGTAKDSHNALTAFFARVSFRTYRDALTEIRHDNYRRRRCSPEVPIPLPGACGGRLGVGGGGAGCGDRAADGAGLFDDWGEIGVAPHAAANPLARPLARRSTDGDAPASPAPRCRSGRGVA